MHASIRFPTRRTWVKSIQRGNFIIWPLVTVKNVNKYFSESKETVKGHMNHQRQGVKSPKLNGDIIPGLQHNSLVSVGKIADAGYYTIFMPGGEGLQVFDAN